MIKSISSSAELEAFSQMYIYIYIPVSSTIIKLYRTFPILRKFPCAPLQSISPFPGSGNHILFPHLTVLPFPEHHIITQYRITQYRNFHVQPLELSIMLLWLIHTVAWILLLFMAEWYSIIWIHHNLFILSQVGAVLGCLLFLAIMNKAAMDICI